jgi:hypothetical protein
MNADELAKINAIVPPPNFTVDGKFPARSKEWKPVPPGSVTMANGQNAGWMYIKDGDSPYYLPPLEGGVNPNTTIPKTTPIDKIPGVEGGRILGVDAFETAHANKPADKFANQQAQYYSDLHDKLLENGYTIKNVGQGSGQYGRDLLLEEVYDKNGKLVGDMSSIMIENGAAKSAALPSNVNVNTKSFWDFNRSEDIARQRKDGVWDPALRNEWEAEQLKNTITKSPLRVGTHNKKYNQRAKRNNRLEDQEYKIGDVYLPVNPTGLTISQMRTSFAVPLLGYESKPTSSYTARTTIKLQCIFPDAAITGDLHRILLQFKYCPVNLIQSKDLFNKLAHEGQNKKIMSSLQRDYAGTWTVPVTMDEWTIYTIDGHPGAIGAIFQFSLFNYTAYFNDSPLDRIEYFRYADPTTDKEKRELIYGKEVDKSYIQKHDPRLAELIEKKTVSIPDTNKILYRDKTLDLEDAIHPYNFNVEDDMVIVAESLKTLHLGGMDSSITIWKVSAAKTDKQAYRLAEPEAATSYVETDVPDSIIQESLVKSISIKFENIWGWLPVLGYSQPVAQYIGPGATHLSINFQTENPGTVARLLKTYNEIAEKDELFGIYDDRYIVSTYLTIFANTELCSLKDISVNTIPGHPKVSDINIMFQKNEYAVNAKEMNPAAQFDEYWGLSRIFKPLQNPAYSKLIAQLLTSHSNPVDNGDYVASANTKNVFLGNMRKTTRDALNLVFKRLTQADMSEKYGTAAGVFKRLVITKSATNKTGVAKEFVDIMVNFTDRANTGKKKQFWTDLEQLLIADLYTDNMIVLELREELLKLADSHALIDHTKYSLPQLIAFSKMHGTATIALPGSLTKKYAPTTIVRDHMAPFLSTVLPYWTKEEYESATGRNLELTFYGLGREAKVVEEILGAGIDPRNKLMQNFQLMEKYSEVWSQPDRVSFPAFGVTMHAVGEDGSNVSKIEPNVNYTFVIAMTYDHRTDRGVAPLDTMPDLIAQQKKAAVIAEEINKIGMDKKTIAKPYAGHRYYPQIERFIAPDQLLSMSVGEWFADSQILDLDGLLNRVGNIVHDIKSPISDTPAWKAAFKSWGLSKTPNSEFEKMINDSGPLGVLQAVAYPDLKRDMTQTGMGRKLIGGMVDTAINVLPEAWKNERDAVRAGKPANENDQPLSSMSQLFFSKDFFGMASKIAVNQQNFMDSLIAPRMYLNKGTMTAMQMNDTIHTNLGKACVVLPNKQMVTAGEATMSDMTNGMIENIEAVGAPINKTLKYEGTWIINSANIAQQKDPAAGDAAYKAKYLTKGGSGYSGYDSPTVVALATKPPEPMRFQAGGPSPSFEGELLGGFNATDPTLKAPVNPGPFREDYAKIKRDAQNENSWWSATTKSSERYNTWGANTQAFADASKEYNKALAAGSTVKVETPWTDLFIAMQLEATYGAVSDSTRWQLGQKYLMSQLPTSGAQNAFPTYKMYIIKSDTSDYKFYSLDDYYDFRLVQDVMVIRDKNNPVHLLKARILIDPRYITISDVVRQKYMHDNEIASGQSTPASDVGKIDTKDETLWSMGRVPMRVGMRIAMKMGYHTDPRQLETVFIGTITSLNGNMNSGIYDIECHGDGRELTVPAATENKEIYGLNYSEIIAAILKSNPNVIHFGKVYGTWLERFSREHYILMAIGKASINGGLLSPAALIGSGVGMACISPMLGAGMMARGVAAAGMGTGIAMVPFSTDWNSMIFDGHMTEKFHMKQSNWANSRMNSLRQWFNGAVYDSGKSSRQIAAHLYETYELNNDPVDDNIFAVDIWGTFSSGKSMRVNNKRSIWSVLQDIKRMYPNFCLDVRPYGNRSTIFLGPSEFSYWRTDDPLVAMAPQLLEISNRKVKYDDRAREAITMNIERNVYGNITPENAIGKNGIAPLIPFQKQHIVTSFSDIVMNGIRSTPERGWNEVVLSYGKNANENNADPDTMVVKANQNIEPGSTKRQYVMADWITTASEARQYAVGVLKEGVERMYGGTLVVRGNPKIEPNDRVYVCDKVNKMYGWIEVETVIHKFDQQSGFTTHIVPNMVCSINSDAYKSSGHIVRQLLHDKLGQMTIGGIASGVAGFVAGGVVISALFSAMPFLVAIGGPVLMAWALSGAAKESYDKSMDTFNKFTTKDDDEYLGTVMENAMKINLASETFFGGYALRMLVKAVRYVKGADVKAAVSTAYEYAAIYAGSGKAKAAEYHSTILNHSSKGFLESLAAKMETTVTGLSTKTAEQVESFLKEMEKDDAGKKKAAKIRETLEKKGGLKKILTDVETNIAKQEVASTASAAAKEARLTKIKAGDLNTKSFKGKAGGLIKNGFTLAMLAFLEAIPVMVEGFCIIAMTNTNVIVLHPLWVKNSLLLTGLEGYRTTSAFMHIKDQIMFAKKVFTDASDAVADWAPVVYGGAAPAFESSSNIAHGGYMPSLKMPTLHKSVPLGANDMVMVGPLTKTASDTNLQVSAIRSALTDKLDNALVGKEDAFIHAAIRYQLDPLFLAAIVIQESGNGEYASKNNVSGTMDPDRGWKYKMRFDTIEDSIDYMASNLRRRYINKGLTTVEEIAAKYAPINAANDPNNLNRHWAPNVSRNILQLTSVKNQYAGSFKG